MMQRVFLSGFIFVYSAVIACCLLLVRVLAVVTQNNRIMRWEIEKRWHLPDAAPIHDGAGSVWIHGASLGEVKVGLKFKNLLKSEHIADRFIMTAFSATGCRFLMEHTDASVHASGYYPIDTESLISAMIDRFQIRRVWLVETELWPGLLWSCLKKNIPVGIINGRMECSTFRCFLFLKPLIAPLLMQLNPIFVQNEGYAQRFKAVTDKSTGISCCGNLKSCILIRQPEATLVARLRQRMGRLQSDTLITVGCLHPAECLELRRCIDAVRQKGLAWKWIIVPRHIEKSEEICRNLGFPSVLTSSPDCDTAWDILVVGAVGILEDMYMAADGAVVGGTFTAVGGHSVWEPIQHGIPVFFGPDFHTQRQSYEQLMAAQVGFQAPDGQKLAETMETVLQTRNDRFIPALVRFAATLSTDSRTLIEQMQKHGI
ncbi:MAG: hypothetical protein JW795_22140 [Chitinivibrionales bacterium]|nr:hypothetical protein [Chitinivibrionales bacterium]